MAVADERLLYEIIRLQNRLVYPARLVVAPVYEQLFQQLQRRGDVLLQHTGGDQQVRPALAQITALRDKLHARRESAQGCLDLGLEPIGGVVLGAQFTKEGGQYVQQAQLVRVEIRHVEVQIQIDYAVGVGIQPQYLHAVNAGKLGFRRNDILGHVLKIQVRQRGEVFLAVHALLPLLHFLEFRSGLCIFRVVPVRGDRGQTLRLLARILLPLLRGRQGVHIALVFRAAEHFGEQIGEITGVQLPAQGVEYPRVVYMRERIVSVEPAVQRADGEVQPGRFGYLAVGERGALKRRGQGFSVESFRQQPAHRFGDERPYRGEILRRGVAHDDGDIRLIHPVVHVDAHVLREAPFQKRALERRFVGAGQVIGKYLRRVQLLDILVGAENLRRRHMRQRLFALAHLVADSLFRGHGRLHSEVEVRRTVLVLRQVLPVDILQHRVDIHMPVEENARVRGVIEAFVRGGELLVAQAGYVLGIAAADIAVARVGIEQAVHLVADERIHIGKRALHLAEHDAVIVRLAGLAVELVVPALLHEYLRALMYQRAEHRVEIDGHEVKRSCSLRLETGYSVLSLKVMALR